MASVRNLKKDIGFLASELVTEAYVKQLLKDNIDQNKIADLLVETIDYRNKMVEKANHPDGKDNPKLVRAFYTKLRKEMYEQYLAISGKINEL